MNELERITTEQHGIHTLVVKGPEGAVQFALTKHPLDAWRDDDDLFPGGWLGLDLGIHSPTSRRSDEYIRDDCPYVPGRCHYAASSEPALRLVREWAAAGYDDGVLWRAAELHYRAVFVDGLLSEAELMELVDKLLDREGEP